MSPEEHAEICEHARGLAAGAPPLTPAQALLVASVYARYRPVDCDGGDDAAP
jgi:hypothetical protein